MDMFLPYAFLGAAVARVDVVRSATVSYTRHDIPDSVTPPALPITPEADFRFGPESRGVNRKGVFAYGYTGGLGLDVALLPNVFVRAEWQVQQMALYSITSSALPSKAARMSRPSALEASRPTPTRGP